MSKPPPESAFVADCVTRFRAQLEALADPGRAAQEKRYLKSPFRFYGVTVPKLRAIARDFRRATGALSKGSLWALCSTLWGSEFHEERALAMLLLEEHSAALDLSDMPALERMLRESVNWDQVDEISVHLVGTVLGKDGRAFDYLERWRNDDNYWLRRAALLAQLLLLRAGRGDKGLFFSLADQMMEEKEFFIRKAIGWVLREMARQSPEEVFRFVTANRARMSGVTFREAVRRLPPELEERLKI